MNLFKCCILTLICFSSIARVTSHKTAGLEFPENSLEGFKHSLELDIDAIEFDVHFTRDRVAVLSHDPVLDEFNCFREKKEKVVISKVSLEEVQSIECFNSKLGKTYKVPTLESILRTYINSGRTDVELNIEIKVLDKLIEKWSRYKEMDHNGLHLSETEMAQLIYSILRKFKLRSNVLLTTFSRTLLLKLKSLKRDDEAYRYGLLFKGIYTPILYPLVKAKGLKCFDTCWWPNWKNTYKWLIKNKIDVFMPNWPQLNHSLYNKSFRRTFQKKGYRPFKIYPWTLNKEEDWEKLEGYNFDGVVTDKPTEYLLRK